MKKTQMTHTRRTVLLAALGGGISLFSQGCGGGGAGTRATGTGSATYKLTWPEATRLVPQASNSIQISVLDGTKVLKTAVLQRPATEITIKELPAKKLVNLVQAFPNADGSGIAQAQVRTEVEIKADETVKVSLTMASTIERLEPSLTGTMFVGTGDRLALAGTPRNAAGEAVLIKADTLRWTSSAPTVASVDSSGGVTAIGSGEVTITATEPESGKSVSFSVVAGPVGRVVYSQIDGNVRGNFLAQPGRGHIGDVEIDDPAGGDFPALEYGFEEAAPRAFPNVSREFFITLSPGIAVGTRLPVPSLARNPFVSVELVELQTVVDGSGNTIRRVERWFQGVSGNVTMVKIEGGVSTLRLENVRMQASPGFHYSFADVAEAQGTFVANGTLTYEEQSN